MQSVAAVPPSAAASALGGTAAADTEEQSHSPPSVFWPAQRQPCQVMRISVSVFVVLSFVYTAACVHTHVSGEAECSQSQTF